MGSPLSVTAEAPSDEPTEESPIIGEHDRRRRRKRRRRLIAGATVIVVAGAGTGAWFLTRGGSASATNTAGPVGLTTKTELVAATRGNMETTVSASGTLEPAHDDDYTFAVSGTVTSVKVAAGQKVKKGQILATVGTTALKEAVSEAKETLTAAKAALTTAKDDSDQTSVIDQDEATVNTDETAVTTAEDDLTDADLRSTITGEVSSVGLAVGDSVSSGSGNTGSGTAGDSGSGSSASSSSSTSSSSSSDDIEVVSTGRFTVSADVDDTEVHSIKVGQKVNITPSGSSTAITGKVTSVGLVASTSSDVADFPVTINVTGVHNSLYAGDSATASIITKDLKNVIEVPTAAISYTTGNPTVTVSENGKQTTKNVVTGTTLNDETQITRGLKVGEKVLEKVISFKTGSGGTRSLFGGSGTRSGGFGRSGSFPGGGSFSRSGGSGGFPGGGSFSGNSGSGR